MRRWRLRDFDFLVNKWLLKALYLRILPVPVTLNVFFARECVFIFGMVFKFGIAKVINFCIEYLFFECRFDIFFKIMGNRAFLPIPVILPQHNNTAILIHYFYTHNYL
jgi:hypothetical protein